MNGPRLREAGVEAVAVCLLWSMIGESMGSDSIDLYGFLLAQMVWIG